MTIVPCASDSPHLLSFVLPYEKLAVGLVSHILQSDTALFLVQTADGTTRDAFSFSDGGQIFHCLPDAYGERRGELLRALTDFFRTQAEHEFFNIIGEEKGTDLVRTAIHHALSRTTRHEQHYILLEEKAALQQHSDTAPRNRTNALRTRREAFSADPLTIVQCVPSMIDDLLPLQVAYEKEEVAWAGERIDENVTRLTFQRALRTQQIFAIAKNGVYIAKGGTNALGKNYAQLGGIYTVPSERGKGYATTLVRHITTELRAQGKKAVLFAKPENAPALRLYEVCGFRRIGRFAITYF